MRSLSQAFQEGAFRHTHHCCGGIECPTAGSHQPVGIRERERPADFQDRFATQRPRLRFRTEKTGDSRQAYQSVADGIHDQFGGFVNSQRIHDVGAMYGNRVDAQVKHRSNLFG